MNNHEHLTDNEIVYYLNNCDKMTEEQIRRVETHFYITKCNICYGKYHELQTMRKSFLSIKSGSDDDEEIFVCKESDKVEDLINGRLAKSEREKYVAHLSKCDMCREATAILLSTEALKELEKVGSKEKEAGLWDQLNNGIMRMKEVINLGFSGFNTPAFGVAEVKFRGGEEGTVGECHPIKVDLPEKQGNIKVFYTQQSVSGGKITIEPLEVADREMLVEIYNENGSLLKSVDSVGPVTCSVSTGKCRIMINSTYEIVLNIGD
jgi:hypothetical protein